MLYSNGPKIDFNAMSSIWKIKKYQIHTRIILQLTVCDQCSQMLLIGQL